MNSPFIIALLSSLTTVIGALLVFAATRKKDVAEVDLGRDKLALEAMAEYVTLARSDLKDMRDLADKLRNQLDECLMRKQ